MTEARKGQESNVALVGRAALFALVALGGIGCGEPQAESRPTPESSPTAKRYHDEVPTQDLYPHVPKGAGLRDEIFNGPYAGKHLSYVVNDYDRAKRKGILSIIGNEAVRGNPISELLVIVDGDSQEVLINRNMPVPYDRAAVAELIRHWGSDEAIIERQTTLRRIFDEYKKDQEAESRR